MSLNSTTYPHLPSLKVEPEYSFYPYPISSRSSLHSTLQRSIRGVANPPSAAASGSLAGPGPTSQRIKEDAMARRRAEGRAVAGLRPPGVGLGREADELDDEEAMLEDEKARTNAFGQRFLLPIGRRQTQMEMDNANSPTPSEADHDRRQEDQHGAEMVSPPLVAVGDDEEDEDEPGGGLDLDASMEDLDGDMDNYDASMEEGAADDMDDEDE